MKRILSGTPSTVSILRIAGAIMLLTINAALHAQDFTGTAPYTHSDNTCNFSTSLDCDAPDGDAFYDVTYRITLPSSQTWVFSLCSGTSYDSKIMVGTSGCAFDLGYNDDFCGTASQVTLTAGPGDVWVTVDGFRSFFDPLGECGPYTLDIDYVCVDSPNVVTSTADSGPGSLRDAIAYACPGSVITFDPSLMGDTITLSTSLDISDDIAIHGPGMDDLFISGGGTSIVFYVFSSGGLEVKDLSIIDGFYSDGGSIDCFGELDVERVRFQNCVSAIYMAYSYTPTFSLVDCDFVGNYSLYGTGSSITSGYAPGTITGCTFRDGIDSTAGAALSFFNNVVQISRSTISGNSGGGLRCSNGQVSLTDCTVADNLMGIQNSGFITFIDLTSTIVADNGTDLNGDGSSFISNGYNLIESIPAGFTPLSTDIIGIDPMLLPLADNGGLTSTHAIGCSSLAVDAGDPTDVSPDQIGQPVFNGTRDIGSYEFQGGDTLFFTVTTNADSGPGSLRDIISNACPGSTISFDPSLLGQTIALSSQISIEKDVVIQGPGMDSLFISGGGLTTIFFATAGHFEIQDLTLIDGGGEPSVAAVACLGGNLVLQSVRFENNLKDLFALAPFTIIDCDFHGGNATSFDGSSITVQNSTGSIVGSTFRNGIDASGGAIRLFNSNVSIARSTLSGNAGAGLINEGGSTCDVSASTIADNATGIDNSGSVTLSSTIVGDNGTDLNGAGSSFTSNGYNLIESVPAGFTPLSTDIIGIDPMLLPLADNGGSTFTHAFEPCSKAFERGGPSTDPDQTGKPVQGNVRDIGAWEATTLAPPTEVHANNGDENFVNVKWIKSCQSDVLTKAEIYRNGNLLTPLTPVSTEFYQDPNPATIPSGFNRYDVRAEINGTYSYMSGTGSALGRKKPSGSFGGAVQTQLGTKIRDVEVCAVYKDTLAERSALVIDNSSSSYASVELNMKPTGSLALWVHNNDWTSSRGILENGAGVGAGNIDLHFSGTELIWYQGTTQLLIDSLDELSSGWHHIGATWQDSAGTTLLKFYLDGQLQAANATLSSIVGAQQINLGRGLPGGLNGRLDEFQFWDVAKSPDWMRNEAHRIPQQTTGDLQSYLRFEKYTLNGQSVYPDWARNDTVKYAILNGTATVGAGLGYPVGYCDSTAAITGVYDIRQVAYGRNGLPTSFKLKPRTDRFYDPEFYNSSLTDGSENQSGLFFVDTTVFNVTGTVLLEGENSVGDCGFDSIKVNVVSTAGTSPPNFVYTNNNGEWGAAVIQEGQYIFTPEYGDHIFDPPSLTLNVGTDLANKNFSDTTKRRLSGSIRSGCKTVFFDKVDIRITSLEADASSTLGCVVREITVIGSDSISEWLPPMRYSVEIVAIYTDGSGIIPNTGLLVDWGEGVEMIMDLRYSSAVANFIYESKPILDVNEFGEVVEIFDGCGGAFQDSVLIVEQGSPYFLTFFLNQEYEFPVNSITSCPFIPGDISAVLRVTDPSSGVSSPIELSFDSAGQSRYPLYPRVISFATGVSGIPDYGFPFNAQAELSPGQFSTQYNNPFVVTGYRADSATFTTVSPELPLLILRDPPGDGSFSFLESESENCVENTWSVATDASATAYSQVKLGTAFSLGTSIDIPLGPSFDFSTDFASWATFDLGITIGGGIASSTEQITCITTGLRLQTAEEDSQVGDGSTVIYGAAFNLLYSTAQTITYDEDSCGLYLDVELVIGGDSIATIYTYTTDFIRDDIIPTLEQFRDQAGFVEDTNSGSPTFGQLVLSDTARRYQAQIQTWNSTLDLVSKLDSTALEGTVTNPSFDGGVGPRTYYSAVSSSSSSFVETFITLEESVAAEVGYEFAGTGSSAGVSARFGVQTFLGVGTTSNTLDKIGYTLDDDDTGDNYTMDIGTDPVYNTPVFKVLAAETSCPHEQGTTRRDNASMFVDENYKFVTDALGSAIFQLTITNESTVSTDLPRSYYLYLTTASNPDGATVSTGSDLLSDGVFISPVSPAITGGASVIQTIAVSRLNLTGTVGTNAHLFQNMKLLLIAACDNADYLAGKSVDILAEQFITAEFATSCSSADIFNPAEGFIVDASDNDLLLITLTGYDAAALENIAIQTRNVDGNGNWITVETVNAATLLGALGGFYDFVWNVSGRPDGLYQIRARINCSGAWTYSDIITGTIDRSGLQLVLTTPLDGGILSFGNVPSVTFNETIWCGPVDAMNVAAYFTDSGSPVELLDPICGGIDITIPFNNVVTPECSLENQWVTFEVYDIQDFSGNNSDTVRWTFYIDRYADPVLSLSGVNPSSVGGADGSIDLTVSGGFGPYTYSWSNGATSQDLSGLAAGTYAVTVTDAQCSFVTDSITIEDPTTLPAPPNDFCTAADTIGPGIYPVSTINATGSFVSSCGVNDTADVWFYYVPTQTGTVIVSTCGSDFDPVITVRNACVGGPEFGCNDNDVVNLRCGGVESAIELPVVAGNGAYIRVSGANGSTGTSTLSIEEPGMFTGADACVDADTVGPGTYPVSTINATGSFVSSCGVNDTADIWFYYLPTQTGTVIVSTCGSDFDPVITVRRQCVGGPEFGCNDNDVANLRCGGNESALQLSVNAGEGAYIRVSGVEGAVGQTTLTIEEPGAACSTTTPPQNPTHVVETSRVRLEWDAVPQSVACQVKGTRITPPGTTGTQTVSGSAPSFTNVPFTALGAGTTWRYQVRCACIISPVQSTAFSVFDTFFVPAATREMAGPEYFVNLFPNPATHQVTLDLQGYKGETVFIRVLDLDGRELINRQLDIADNWMNQQMDVSMLAPGMYRLVVMRQGGQESVPLVIIN